MFEGASAIAAILAAKFQNEEPSLWFGRALALGSLLLLIVVPVLVIRARRRALSGEAVEKVLADIQGIRRDRRPQPGDVQIVFTTYVGFLVHVTQMTYDLVLPAAQARIVLKRMLRHNLTWGMFAYGALFIPILSSFEYWSQMRKVAHQERDGISA